MTAAFPRIVKSTADLEPAGVGGYAKAIWAGVAAGLAAAGTALADGVLTPLEWVGIASAIILAAGGAYFAAMKVKPVAVVPMPQPLAPITGVLSPPVDHPGNNPKHEAP